MPLRTARAAFTLMELLVVVAIIAALASLLMPAISLVRVRAMSTHCANNLKMMGLATAAYANDNEQVLPYCHTYVFDWYDLVNPFVDNTYQATVYKGASVFRCPLAMREIRNQYLLSGNFSFHYSMNENLRSWWHPGVGWVSYPNKSGVWAPREAVPLALTRPGQVLYADGKVSISGGLRYFLPFQQTYVNVGTSGPWPLEGSVGTFGDPAPVDPTNLSIIRHGGRVNQVFIDGHAAAVTGKWSTVEQVAACW